MKNAREMGMVSGMAVAIALGAWPPQADVMGDSRSMAVFEGALGSTGAESVVEAFGGTPILTLEQFRAVPHDVEREVYQALKPDVQCSLWKSKLAEVLASVELDERQIGVVAMVDCSITPELFENPNSTVTYALLVSLENDARSVFSEGQFNSLFMTLGGTSDVPSAGTETVMELVAGKCKCSTFSDWCFTQTCRRGNCTYRPYGCGFLNGFPCDGLCRP